jgi:hypothetical protein
VRTEAERVIERAEEILKWLDLLERAGEAGGL